MADPQMTAVRLTAGYARGELSPVEAVEAALARITERNGELNAYCLVDADSALEAAKASERRWVAGEPVGLLDGVPVSIKDAFLTRGWPTLRGSRCVTPSQSWDVDAPVAARMREHGAVILGKTTTPELSWKAVTDSPLNGVSRNPHNPALTPGGSSGGSAAAVAAGMGALSVGTDGGGSVRIPASFCGIVGFKPSYGRIPLYPASPFGALAHAGPMARTVRDIALLMDVLASPDHRDPTALPAPGLSYQEAILNPASAIRVAFSPTLGYVDVDPEVAAIVERAVVRLVELGVRVERADPGIADPGGAFEALWGAGAAQWIEAFPAELTGELDPGLAGLWRRSRSLPARDYLDAQAQRAALGIQLGEFHRHYDLLITPTVPIPPFEAGFDCPPGRSARWWPDWTPFTYPFNLTQQPAISLPAGMTGDGRPVGVQLVGRRHDDALVLAVARCWEEALGG